MTPPSALYSPSARRVLVLGATGTIGRATVRALTVRGHAVTALVRAQSTFAPQAGVTVVVGSATDAATLRAAVTGMAAVISCLASRTGAPDDAWAIDHDANLAALTAARAAGVAHFVLLSAICVQKPRLAFQHAKLAFEVALSASGLRWSVVRPTAYFKSLSGQLGRIRRGKAFLVFGDGALTACTPIADDDLAGFIADCLDDPAKWNVVLPIGGPGPALTPLQQGAALFAAAGVAPRFSHVPVRLLDATIGALSLLGRVVPSLAAKAELARIGRYYATESMLVWDAVAGRYDPAVTPATGTVTLAEHYAALVRGDVADDRRDHAVF